MELSGLILVAVVVLIVVGVAYGYYSPGKDKDISQRPQGAGKGGAPGAEGKSRMSAAEDDTEGNFDTHGTK